MTIALLIIFIASTIYFFIPWLKTHRNIRKYRELYKSHDSKLSLCYTDKDGNNWYQFTNLLNMYPMRAIRAEVATNASHLGITPEMFDRYIREAKIALDKGNHSRVGHLLERMDERRLLAAEEETLKGLADAFFVLEGEDPQTTSPYWFDKKKEIWSKDPECYAFFLHAAFSLLRTTSELSKTDLLNYLQTQASGKLLNRL